MFKREISVLVIEISLYWDMLNKDWWPPAVAILELTGWDGVQGNTCDPFQESNVFQTTI